MRDIVSELGTIFQGLALPTRNASINGPAVALTGYDGAMIYINAGTWTDGTHQFTVQITNDVNGSPNNSGWTNVPATDLVAWQATSPTNFAPVKLNDSNGNPTGRSQPNSISSAATAVNQRVGYIGGVQGVSDWLRVITTVSGQTIGAQYDVVIVLGRPRLMPANV